MCSSTFLMCVNHVTIKTRWHTEPSYTTLCVCGKRRVGSQPVAGGRPTDRGQPPVLWNTFSLDNGLPHVMNQLLFPVFTRACAWYMHAVASILAVMTEQHTPCEEFTFPYPTWETHFPTDKNVTQWLLCQELVFRPFAALTHSKLKCYMQYLLKINLSIHTLFLQSTQLIHHLAHLRGWSFECCTLADIIKHYIRLCSLFIFFLLFVSLDIMKCNRHRGENLSVHTYNDKHRVKIHKCHGTQQKDPNNKVIHCKPSTPKRQNSVQ